MNDKEIVVVYPREIKFINKVGGSISYTVDRKVSDYVEELQSNWNSLREWLEEQGNSMLSNVGIPDIVFRPIINKMNELESGEK